MHSVSHIAKEIVAREGGYVNDPDDPGGPTNFGVTLATLKRLGLDVDGSGAINRQDVKQLSAAQAEEIFLKHYFADPGIAGLPEPLQASVFDMYVNAGSNSVKILQRLLNDMGQALVVDGEIGPKTEAATAEVLRLAPMHLVDAYGIARRNYYYRLGDRSRKLRKFARRRDGGKGGWITRAEEFISPRFHLSDAEHADRTATWG
jgi:lysozyme family protein